MLGNFKDAAKTFAGKVDAKDKLEITRQRASAALDAGKNAANAKVEAHWPMVERVLVEGLLPLAEDKLKDDAALQRVFLNGYELLPAPVRFVMSREQFLELSFARRGPLLLKLQDFRAQRSALSAPPESRSSPEAFGRHRTRR